MPLDINFGEVNIPDIFSGLGSLLKSVREAITGEAIVDANKKAELLLKAQELEAQGGDGFNHGAFPPVGRIAAA